MQTKRKLVPERYKVFAYELGMQTYGKLDANQKEVAPVLDAVHVQKIYWSDVIHTLATLSKQSF